jgi:hypothetical protein
VGQMFRRAVPICAAVAVIGGAFAVSSASGFPKKCFLHPEMRLIEGSRGAGSVGYRLTIRNSGPGECTVGRHPRLTLVSESGEGLPTEIVKTGPLGKIAIPVGGTVSARLRFSDDIPPCEPKAARIHVHLGSGYQFGPIDPPTSVCDHGKIEEGALS